VESRKIATVLTAEYHGVLARATLPRKKSKKQSAKEAFSFGLFAIGLFKLFKALLLIAAGVGALRLLHKELPATVMHWLQLLRVDPENEHIHRFLVRLFRVTPKQLKEFSVGTFFYAGLFATEGIGLLLRKHWAEYFTIVTTGALIPLELYELARHFTVVKVAVTAINVLIVWYLIMRVRSRAGR
jgi:uncharacterized membrane protein (DUF2068 family)